MYPRQNVGRQGADIVDGQTVLARGDVLNPSRIGALAALGVADVEVYRQADASRSSRPATRSPIRARSSQPGQIYDINQFTLSTIIAEHGGVPMPYQTAQDTIERLERAIDRCLDCDVLVFSGGSSVGERDLILDVIGRKGEIVFHGIAVKPGKPTVFGIDRRQADVRHAGLSDLVPVERLHAAGAGAARDGAPAAAPHRAPSSLPLGQRIVSTTGRHQFYTVRIVDGQAMPAFKASGDITSMSQADGYIEIPAQTDIVEKGEVVEVKLF